MTRNNIVGTYVWQPPSEHVMDDDMDSKQYEMLLERQRQLEETVRLIEARVKALENSIPPDERYEL